METIEATRTQKQSRPPPMDADVRILRQELLESFLGWRQATFERSTTGAILDRCIQFGESSARCPACDGVGICYPATQAEQDKILKQIEEWKTEHNTKHVRAEALPRGYGCDCKRCKGTGAMPIRETIPSPWPKFTLEFLVPTGPRRHRVDGQWAFDRPLPEVRPTGIQWHAPGSAHEEAIVDYAIASRILMYVYRGNELHGMALAAYYGHPGDRWEGHRRGRYFALYPLTKAGNRLLGRTKDKAGELDPWERLHTLTTGQSATVAVLLDEAASQARELIRNAADSWNEEALCH